MNSDPRPPTLITINYSPEVQHFITDKRQYFIGRQFVFDAIHTFINHYSRGYFTLVGFPGMGKSAILSQYVFKNPQAIFYTCEIKDYNQTEVFLEILFNQLIHTYSLSYSNLPENATSDGWFLSAILQQVSDLLLPEEKLIIIIDCCDRLNYSTQPLGSNVFYLPRYLPENVYILLSRRPFLSEQSGLLVEAPHQLLDLSHYPEQNQQDIQAYLNQFNLDNKTIQNIINQSYSNFKYAVERVKEINQSSSELPPGLIEYYQSHWQQMMVGKLSSNSPISKSPPELGDLGGRGFRGALTINIIDCWTEENEWLSAEMIAEELEEDDYEIQLILEDWIEFLECCEINSEICYRWYHPSFCEFLRERCTTPGMRT